jgi:hypothetical protein
LYDLGAFLYETDLMVCDFVSYLCLTVENWIDDPTFVFVFIILLHGIQQILNGLFSLFRGFSGLCLFSESLSGIDKLLLRDHDLVKDTD